MLSATAAASAVPAPTCFVSAGMRQGARGPAARCLETRLVQLGYALNGPDDVFDSTGAAALRQFQQASRIPVTGAAGPSVLKRLRIWRAVPAPVCSTPWGVRVGDVGFPARCVETRLRQLGYNNITPDDRFDAASSAALKDFQNRVGIVASGAAGPSVLRRLHIYQPTGFPPATCRVHRSVSLWTTGVEARCVEIRLAQLGYAVGGPDLTFDSTSAASLRSFQYRNGLYADSVAGSRTLARLGIYTSTPPAADVLPANSGAGRRIVYSRAQQRIWVVDEYERVLKTHRVSGRTYEPSAGTYHVYSRSLYTYSAKDPSVRWRYMVRFAYGFQGGRIGFHEIPNRNGVPLQTSEQLGLPLSAGCVRQSTPDAQWLWNWAGIGTKVVVL